jgi:hypothetical protein
LFTFFKSQLFKADAKSINDLIPRFARDKDADSVNLRLLRLSHRPTHRECD